MISLRYAAKLGLALMGILGLGVAAACADVPVPVVGGPCEGCDAPFDGLPAAPAAVARIAPKGEPGEPLVLEGVVTYPDGTPASGVVVYAYHTDARGVYPSSGRLLGEARRHGRLRGWAKTDAKGGYRFDTIRPAGYPRSDDPQHIHMHVFEPGRCTYYIDDVVFTDDARLNDAQRANHNRGRGGTGITTPQRDAAGAWHAHRDIALGKGISDYARCGAAHAARAKTNPM